MDNSQTVQLKSRRLPDILRRLPNISGTTTVGNYIITEKRLGRCSSASVYLGHHTLRKFDVAVKKFELIHNNKRIERRAWREIQILQNIRHPNIIKMYDYYYDKKKNNIYIFLEYCPRGSIKTFLGKGGYLDEKYANRLMRQFISGLKYMFSLGIYHRDIKPDNLLLSNNYNLKISDFGLATLNNSGKFHRLCGSPLYMAPEILITASYNKYSDIWSIGMVMFELLFGHHPLRQIKHITDLIKYFNSNSSIEIPPIKKPDDVNLSHDCLDLLRKMLTIKLENRLTWEKLFSHPWANKNIEIQQNKNKKFDDDDNDDDDNDRNDYNDKNKNKNANININTTLNNSESNTLSPVISNKNNSNEKYYNVLANDKTNLNHGSWSPLYLPVLEWKYNENISKIKNDINYEIHDTNLGENTYMSNSIVFEKKPKKCTLINNEIASIEIASIEIIVKKNYDIVKNKIELTFLNSDSITNISYKNSFTIKKKLTATAPLVSVPQKHLTSLEECQTWPLLNFSDVSSFGFYFDHVPVL